MGYSEIASALRVPAGASPRYKRLDALDRLLAGSFFDDIPYSFETEDLHGDYLSLTKRRPSVKYNLARIVVDQSSGSLWADDEMARVVCGLPQSDGSQYQDDDVSQDQRNVDAIFADCLLDAVMMEAYEKSASGSGAIVLDVGDDGMPTFTCLQGKYVRATWTSPGSQILFSLEYVYPTVASEMLAAGTDLPQGFDKATIDPNAPFWCKIAYTAQATLYYEALSAIDYENLGKPRDDFEKTIIRWQGTAAVAHTWGIVPAVYLRSLLFGSTDDDGRCAYEDITDVQVEIARILSQIGRGIRYAADPLLVRERGEIGSATKGITEPSIEMFGELDESFEVRGRNGETIRSASNVIEGKARLLEMTGAGLATGLEYVRTLREWALEVAGGMKADASSTKGVMSGRAIDLLQQMSRLLVKRQRIAYGQRGLLPLMRFILSGCANGVLLIEDVIGANPKARMRCEWPKTGEADAITADMEAEREQARIDGDLIKAGIASVNEIREKRGLPAKADGDGFFIEGKGPWTGASALGAKPDDEAKVSLVDADGNVITPAVKVEGDVA